MKRFLALVVTSVLLAGTFSVAFAQAPTTAPAPGILADLISTETNPNLREELLELLANRDEIVRLRALHAARVAFLRTLLPTLPPNTDPELLEKAQGILEGFEGVVNSGKSHDRNILRRITNLQSDILLFRQAMATPTQNIAPNDRNRPGVRKDKDDDDDDDRRGNRQNARQNRRNRNFNSLFRRLDNIEDFQERVIRRLERRIDRIEDLIDELT